MIMRKSIVIVLVLLVLSAVAPFGFGFWADSRLNTLLEDLNESGLVSFTIIKTSRGWLSTESVVEVELAGQLAKAFNKIKQKEGGGVVENPGVFLRSRIYHGPIAFMARNPSFIPVVATIDSRIVKDISDGAEELVNIDYRFRTDLAIQGGSKTTLSIPEWSGPVGKGDAVAEWKDAMISFKLSDGLSKTDSRIDIPFFRISAANGGMALTGLTLSSEIRPGAEDLPVGDSTVEIKNIEFSDRKTGASFNMSNLGITANTDIMDGLLDSKAEIKLGKFTLSGEQYGPAVFKLAFRNFNVASIARISSKMKEIRQNPDMPQDQMNMMIGATMISELSNLLQKGPVIEIGELSLGSSYGKLMGTAMITVDTDRPEMLSNPLLVKDAIIGEVDLEMPEELMVAFTMATLRKEFKDVNIQYNEDQLKTMAKARVNKRMSRLVAGNIFNKVGNMFKFSASIKNGISRVNGKPFQIPFGGMRPAQ
ncbi:MAG TPA: DUF945 domain-containing protein [Gammaproteobacteria bacterium]|nr:DUF945 domain-containing protein [Gammaproteobacteria bacterium]